MEDILNGSTKENNSVSNCSSSNTAVEVVEKPRPPTPNILLRDFILSIRFQTIMLTLAFVYMFSAFGELITMISRKKSSRLNMEKIITIFKLLELVIILLFLLEQLIRILFISKRLNNIQKVWTGVDLLLIIASGCLDISAFLIEEHLSHITLSLISFRILSAMRALYFVNRARIKQEEGAYYKQVLIKKELEHAMRMIIYERSRVYAELRQKKDKIRRTKAAKIELEESIKNAQTLNEENNATFSYNDGYIHKNNYPNLRQPTM